MAESTVALDLPLLLPDALDGRDRCITRLTDTLRGAAGLDDVHVVAAADGDPARLCLHYDPAVTNLARIRALAEAGGATITDRYRHVLWTVTGIAHVRRARVVAEALRSTAGVVEADASPGLVRVEFDRTGTDEATIRSVLARLDVVADHHDDVHDGDHGTTDTHGHGGHHHHDHEHDHDHGHGHGRRELVVAATAAAVWVVAFALEHLTPAADGALVALYAVAGVLGGWFAVREALDSVRRGRVEIDALMLLAAGGAAGLGRWEEGALLLVLFSLGHALEGVALGRARSAIAALGELAPPTATVRRDGREHVVPVAGLRIGDVVLARPHARIPADGVVVAGTSSVDQSALTGESVPVDKRPAAQPTAAGDPADRDRGDRDASGRGDLDAVAASSRVYAGTFNGSGPLEIRVARRAADTAASKLAALVRDAETQGSPTQRFAERFERIFVPVVLALVVVVLVAGGLLGSSWAEAAYRSMAVLVAAGPCALAIATPSAVLAAVARAGQLGVLVKGGGPLEHLGAVRAVAFDKTGTLTEGQPRLVDVRPAAGVTAERLLAVAVAVESHSDHPIARAVARDGSERLGTTAVPSAHRVVAVPGRGLRAMIDDAPALVGNVALLDDRGHEVDAATRHDAAELQAAGRTIVAVVHGDEMLGLLGVMDAPRPDARAAVAALADVGVRRTVMLSGDHQGVADAVAAEVGIAEAWGDLLPDDKVAAVARLRDEEGVVAMVGDGVNDAPALAHATVGIAMGAAGSPLALETADVALMGDDLGRLPAAIELGRRASRVIRQNLMLSLGMVAVLVPATIVGVVGIGPAVVLHEGSTLVVVANALRLLAVRPRSLTPGPGSADASSLPVPVA